MSKSWREARPHKKARVDRTQDQKIDRLRLREMEEDIEETLHPREENYVFESEQPAE